MKKNVSDEELLKILKQAQLDLQELHIKPHRFTLKEADIDTYPPPSWDVTIIQLDRALRCQTRIYIITHVYQGILQDVNAFANEEEADKYEKGLCEKNGLPWDRYERRLKDSDDVIQQWAIELK